jgi:hypothetical protein
VSIRLPLTVHGLAFVAVFENRQHKFSDKVDSSTTIE